MSEIVKVKYDNTPEEINAAYRAFQNKYTLRRKIIYTIVYVIVIVLAADLIVKNPTNPAGYFAGGLAVGILIFNWIKPVIIEKKMMRSLEQLGTDETYEMRLYDDRIEVETDIVPEEAETEIVAISTSGVVKVEEGSDAAKEIEEHPELVRDDTEKVEKTVYKLAETEICMGEGKDVIFVFVNRSYIHAVPRRCLSDSEYLDFKAYFEDKSLT